jgi:hypothetical protein
MAGPGLEPLTAACGSQPLAPGALVELTLPPGLDAAAQIGIEAQAAWADKASGLAYWFARTELVAERLLVSRGLPGAAAMSRLLGAHNPA